MSKIFIAVPTYENIYPDTFKSIYGLDHGGHQVVFDFVRGYDCATARNNIARQALNENADYVLMVDNDVTIPRDTIINLLEHNEDVLLGYYAHRYYEPNDDATTSICKLYDNDGNEWFNFPNESQYRAKELEALRNLGAYKIEIHGGGMGCAMIRTDIFNQLEFPYFKWTNYPDGQVLGEDLHFCVHCRNNGIKIFADTRVGCGHMMRFIQGV